MLRERPERGRPARDGAGDHRRAARHASRARRRSSSRTPRSSAGSSGSGALGRERWTLEERLHSLERKEFVRRERRSSVAGEDEYAFRHALVRDVAYEQIPRAAAGGEAPRARPSGSSRSAGPRTTPRCSPTTTRAALEYARATGQDVEPARGARQRARCETPETARCALNAYRGRRALLRARGRALAATTTRERPELLLRLASRAPRHRGDERRRRALEERARGAPRPPSELELAAEADALLAEALVVPRRARCVRPRTSSARTRSSTDLPPSPAKAHVLSQVSRYRMLAGDARGRDSDRRAGARDGRRARARRAAGAARSSASASRRAKHR